MSALAGYDGGYPYLRIARHYGVGYGAVLELSDQFSAGSVKLNPLWFNLSLRADVYIANTHFRMVRSGAIDMNAPYAAVF